MYWEDIRKIKGAQPLYIRLYEQLKIYIDSEEARTLKKLPREMDLCRIFKVSRNTVTQALSMLEKEQLICRIKHRGTFLASGIHEFDPQNLRRTVGAVFPEGGFAGSLAVIRSSCRRLGYDFRLYQYSEKEYSGMRLQLEKAVKRCCGIILYAFEIPENSDVRRLARVYPLVFFDIYVTDFECNAVATDHFLGAYRMAETILRHGAKKPCLLVGNTAFSSVRLRAAGFRQALEDHHVKLPSSAIWTGGLRVDPDFLLRSGFDAVLDTDRHHVAETFADGNCFWGRFDGFFSSGKNRFRTVAAIQNEPELGRSAMLLLKEILRGRVRSERKILIAPEIISNERFTE